MIIYHKLNHKIDKYVRYVCTANVVLFAKTFIELFTLLFIAIDVQWKLVGCLL